MCVVIVCSVVVRVCMDVGSRVVDSPCVIVVAITIPCLVFFPCVVVVF